MRTSINSRSTVRSQQGRFRLGMLLLFLVLSLSGIGAYLWREYQHFSNAQLLAAGSEKLSFEFPKGAGVGKLMMALQAKGLNVGERWQWRMLASQLELTDKLKAGEYEVTSQSTPKTLLFALAAGDVVQHKLRLIEGTRFKDFRRTLAQHPAVKQTIGSMSDEEVMRAIGAPETNPEGLFLAETYQFPRGFTDIEILRKSYWDLQKILKAEWEQRAKDVPLANPYEALILASIVEKETGQASERPQIAGVFTRRLKLNMRLQTDPTVIYGIGEAYDGNIRRKDLTTDTPYNTYTRAGLTPTPIAMPGKAAIRAALNPAAGDALYFVAKGNGTHHFSATYAEHDRAVDQYQRNR
jgi:UPF0755 protein